MSGYCRNSAAAIYYNATISKWDEMGDRFSLTLTASFETVTNYTPHVMGKSLWRLSWVSRRAYNTQHSVWIYHHKAYVPYIVEYNNIKYELQEMLYAYNPRLKIFTISLIKTASCFFSCKEKWRACENGVTSRPKYREELPGVGDWLKDMWAVMFLV